MLMGGMGIACVVAVCEFVWKSRKVVVEERVTFVLFFILVYICVIYYFAYISDLLMVHLIISNCININNFQAN